MNSNTMLLKDKSIDTRHKSNRLKANWKAKGHLEGISNQNWRMQEYNA